jgi:hypothetical protein
VLRQAVWPAIWPAVGLVAVLWVGLPFAGSRLAALGALLILAGLVYEALFVGLAISPRERRTYWSKLVQLARRDVARQAAA